MPERSNEQKRAGDIAKRYLSVPSDYDPSTHDEVIKQLSYLRDTCLMKATAIAESGKTKGLGAMMSMSDSAIRQMILMQDYKERCTPEDDDGPTERVAEYNLYLERKTKAKDTPQAD